MSPSARLLAVLAAVLALPLFAAAQRFGGSGAPHQRGNPPAVVSAPQTSPSTGRGSQGRPDQLVPWEWWNDDAVKKEMRLTDQQVRAINRIYEERSRQMKPHSDEFEKQRAELEKMTRERAVDVATYSIQVTRVEALRTELSKTRTVMLYSIYRMLTPEQYQKLEEIRNRRRSGRGGSPDR